MSGEALRRKFPRRQFKRSVGVLYQGQYMVCHGHEIGEGGLAFFLSEPLPEGALVVLNFQIPQGEFVSVKAEVKSIAQSDAGYNQHGCAFVNIKFNQKREIRTFVSART